MKFTYQINAEDLLAFQMFHAQQSEYLSEKLQRKRQIETVLPLLFSFAFFYQGRWVLGILAVVFSVLYYLIHPFFIRKNRRRYFQSHIEESCQQMFSGPNTIEVKQNGIYTYAYIGTGAALILPNDRIPQAQIDNILAAIRHGKIS